jgi:chemotaxis protein MotC
VRHGTRVSLIVLIATWLAIATRAGAETSISDLMNDLQRMQTRMAEGDTSAYPLAQDKLRAIAAAIASAKPEIWKDKTQTDAVAAFVFSGGQPREVARLLERGDVPTSEDALVRGSLAYASGRERDARTLLGDIDPRQRSLRLAGQLAYAQSLLLTSRDRKRAIELLDLARLFAPGSLVEEATLRREILLLSEQRDGGRVVSLSRQYVTRFGHSIYAENFIQGLAMAAVKHGLGDDIEGFQKFDPLLALVTPEQRRIFLLTMARAQIVNGKYEVAWAAAAEASFACEKGSPEEARARFYAAAAQFVGPDYEGGLAALEGLDRGKLPKPDQGLFDAVLRAARHLRDAPSSTALGEAGREDGVAAARSPNAADGMNADPASQTIQRAERALASAAAVGGGAP